MNVAKFFELAKAAGVSESELVISKSDDLEMSVYDATVENYGVSSSASYAARGIYKGKMGFAISDKADKTTPHYLIDQIKASAGISESDDVAIIFKGSEKYKKKNVFNKDLALVSETAKLDNLFAIEKALKAQDGRINDVESVSYSESTHEMKLYNSHGLKLATKGNHFYYVASVVVKEKEDVKTGFVMFLNNDHSKFSVYKFAGKVAKDALSKLGATPIPGGKYPVVFNPRVTASLLGAYLSSASAERVEKKTSLFADKIGEKVASSKVTILDAPLTNNVFYSYFDGEGVAKTNKPIVKNGVLQTFLHNLSTASKMGVAPTGNGTNTGGKIGIGISNVVLKPGKKDFAALISGIKEGLFITEVMGLHSGLNPTSGDFSLQAAGFMIKDGKIAGAVNLITVAGNLLKLFKDVVDVGSENELQLSSYTTSSIHVKSLTIAS